VDRLWAAQAIAFVSVRRAYYTTAWSHEAARSSSTSVRTVFHRSLSRARLVVGRVTKHFGDHPRVYILFSACIVSAIAPSTSSL
jgi:hypothetical protein